MAITIDGDSGVSGVNGSATTPALQGTDSNTGIVFGTDTVQVATGGSTRATVDSSGRLLIGHSSNYADGGADDLVVGSTGISEQGITIGALTSSQIRFADAGANTAGYILYNHSSDALNFSANGTQRMGITSNGSVVMGQTSVDLASGGFSYRNNSADENVAITTTRTGGGGECLNLNRQSSDGNLITFYQASTVEGSISVSGSTVSYNGGHISRWSQLAGGAERTEILRGSVLSNLDEMCEWAYPAQDAVLYTEEDELPEGVSVGDIKTPARDAGTEDNEQLNRMKVSDVEGDANVAGVFMNWDNHDDTYTNDFYCAMTGDFVIRIAQGTTVARGDLLMSAGDGTAKPQDDDIVRSKTIAKVTSTTVSTTYSDGSYCVPCVLMAC